MGKSYKKENELLKEQLVAFEKLQNNSLITRDDFISYINKTHNGNRDLYNILGYEQKIELSTYKELYTRQDIAKRIVEVYPNACWSIPPDITDLHGTTEDSVFEKSMKALANDNRLKLFHYIRRLDIVTGLGQYGIMLIGVKDGRKLDQPVANNLTLEDVLFLSTYSQMNVTILEYDENPSSERFGKPLFYDINTSTNVAKKIKVKVHYSRVIHVAEDALEDDTFGEPRLKILANRLKDLEKVVGGAAEMFFLNARGGLHMNQLPDTRLDDVTILKENMSDFTNNATRYLRTKAMEVKPINFLVADPKSCFETIMSLICGAKGIPQRLLLGSEQGKLASTQDSATWYQRVNEREGNFCEPCILRPIIDWFIERGILAKPLNNEYKIIWPDLRTVSHSEKADIAEKTTRALNNYLMSTTASTVLPEKQLVEDLFGLQYREKDIKKGRKNKPVLDVPTKVKPVKIV
jgi:hypothetical protein